MQGWVDLAESNGSLLPGRWFIVTCRMTACTYGSALGSTLGNEYGRTLPFTFIRISKLVVTPNYELCVFLYMLMLLLSASRDSRDSARVRSTAAGLSNSRDLQSVTSIAGFVSSVLSEDDQLELAQVCSSKLHHHHHHNLMTDRCDMVI